MYFFLVGDNRIHRYVPVEDVAQDKDDVFITWLHKDKINIDENKRLVVDFTPYKTKQNKMMAHIILSDKDKNLQRVLAFPTLYAKALGKMRAGMICEPTIKIDGDTIFVKEV